MITKLIINQAIGNNKIDFALDQIILELENHNNLISNKKIKDFLNNFILLKSNYNEIIYQKIQNVIDPEKYTIEKSKIIKQLLEMVDLLFNEDDFIKKMNKIEYDFPLKLLAKSKIDTIHGEFDIWVFHNGKDQIIVLSMGNLIGEEDVFCRIHSQCVTAHDFFAVNCDCREQMDSAQKQIKRLGKGVIIYLEQEGRGNGVAAHIASLPLKQAKGEKISQSDAYEMVGFPADNRSFYVVPHVLKQLGIKSIYLNTSNAKKLAIFKNSGIEVRKQLNYTKGCLVVRGHMRIVDIVQKDAIPIHLTKGIRIFTLGDINVDYVALLDSKPKDGSINMKPEPVLGGTGYNAAIAFAENDIDSILCGYIGADSNGDFIVDSLSANQNITSILFEKEEKSSGEANIFYFKKLGSREIWQTDDNINANFVYNIDNIKDTLKFCRITNDDIIFLSNYLFFRNRDVKFITNYLQELSKITNKIILDLMPHDIFKSLSYEELSEMMCDYIKVMIVEYQTLANFLKLTNFPEEPTEDFISLICEKFNVGCFILRYGEGNISKQTIIKRMRGKSFQIIDDKKDTNYPKNPKESRGFGDRLAAKDIKQFYEKIF